MLSTLSQQPQSSPTSASPLTLGFFNPQIRPNYYFLTSPWESAPVTTLMLWFLVSVRARQDLFLPQGLEPYLSALAWHFAISAWDRFQIPNSVWQDFGTSPNLISPHLRECSLNHWCWSLAPSTEHTCLLSHQDPPEWIILYDSWDHLFDGCLLHDNDLCFSPPYISPRT